MRTSPSDVDTAFISHPIDKYPESDVEHQVKTLPEVASRSSTGGQEIRLDWRVNQLTCSGHKKDDIYSEHINGTKANRPKLRKSICTLREGDQLAPPRNFPTLPL